MAGFRDIQRGRRARKTIPFPLDNAKWKDGAWSGNTTPVDVRVLTPGDDVDVYADAGRYARDRGAEPRLGDPIYDYALQVHTLLRACIDTDSPADEPAPFFESFDQVMRDESISREHVAYLYEQQQRWQTECSPRQHTMTPAAFAESVLRLAGGDAADFLGMSPGMQLSFARSMAVRLASSRVDRSSSGTASAPTGSGN